jgi:tRNA(Ile)-lysidine synthase
MRDPGDLVARVEATGLLRAGEPVVVMLSGGRDSTCLLDLAVRIVGAEGVSALHVNYGLRGAASDADEHHCRALCERLGVRIDVERAGEPEGNVQAWAREVRYAAGLRRAEASGAVLAVGHTTDDQIETFLYRLATSPSRRALYGMDVRRGRLARPLLAAGISREQTAAWCRAHGLAWREDASNVDPAFARARVRETLVPALRAVDPRADANVLRTIALLREEGEVLDALVDEVLGGGEAIELERLRSLPPALARLVLRRLAEGATGRLAPRVARRLDDVLALREGALDLGDGVRVRVRRGMLSVEPTPPLPNR